MGAGKYTGMGEPCKGVEILQAKVFQVTSCHENWEKLFGSMNSTESHFTL